MRLNRSYGVQVGISYRTLPYTVNSETRFREQAENRSLNYLSASHFRFLEMPAILTYRFGTVKRRPFVGIGPVFRFQRDRWFEASHGAVAAFGFDLVRHRRWALTTQLRYTRWGKSEIPPEAAQRSHVQALFTVAF